MRGRLQGHAFEVEVGMQTSTQLLCNVVCTLMTTACYALSRGQVEAKDPLSFDAPLKKACADDLTLLCPNERRDHSRQLACLRAQHDKLSETCKAEELRFSEMEVRGGSAEWRRGSVRGQLCFGEDEGFASPLFASGSFDF